MNMMDIVARIPVERTTDGVGHQTPVPIYRSGNLRERTRIFPNKAGLIS